MLTGRFLLPRFLLPPSRQLLICLAFLFPFAHGCGGGDEGGTSNPPPAAPSLVTVAADELEIGEYLPPLDEARIELADPTGWERFPRSKKYLARFYRGSSSTLPWIIVTADDSPYEGIQDTTADNYELLLEAVTAEVNERPSLWETPLAMKIGDNYYIRYVLKATLNQHAAGQQILVTVVGGRRYTVDLQFIKGTILDFKSAGYAVAASLRPATTSLPAAPADKDENDAPTDANE